MKRFVHPSPVGPLTLVSDQGSLIGCEFADRTCTQVAASASGGGVGDDAVLDRARAELDQFFGGTLREFTVPLAPRGTEFQRSVWQALRRIPFGQTVSYGQIAKEIGRPAAVRAVGAANGQNPICILIPCHRVIGADGSLTGFGGGLERKSFLLDLERGQAPLLWRQARQPSRVSATF